LQRGRGEKERSACVSTGSEASANRECGVVADGAMEGNAEPPLKEGKELMKSRMKWNSAVAQQFGVRKLCVLC